MTPSTPRAPSRLDIAITAYLALPVFLFCGWLRWPAALIWIGLAAQGSIGVGAGLRLGPSGLRRRTIAALLAFALAWTALAGVGHFVYANADWFTRDATLRDLVASSWPPAYDTGSPPLILRAPVGYYLPSALAGTLLGLRAADVALYLWTALGLALFLAGAAALFPPGRQRLLAVVMLVAFGGLDLAGQTLTRGQLPSLGEHIEWWAGLVQYSGQTTLLFWVPNHALPAWLGIVLVLRHWRQPMLARIAPLCAAAVPLWSPLAAIGLAPFFVMGIAWRRDGRALFSPRSALPWYALAVVEALYLTMDSHGIPGGWLPHRFPDFESFLRMYVLFCLLEFGLVAVALAMLGADSPPLRLAVAVLLALPFVYFGQANDLVMRASIPALAVLALATVAPLARRSGPLRWRIVLGVLLAVGVAGAAQEPERTLLQPRWLPREASLAQLYRAGPQNRFRTLPPHYAGRLVSPLLATVMREPGLVPPAPSPSMEPRP